MSVAWRKGKAVLRCVLAHEACVDGGNIQGRGQRKREDRRGSVCRRQRKRSVSVRGCQRKREERVSGCARQWAVKDQGKAAPKAAVGQEKAVKKRQWTAMEDGRGKRVGGVHTQPGHRARAGDRGARLRKTAGEAVHCRAGEGRSRLHLSGGPGWGQCCAMGKGLLHPGSCE